MAATLLYEDCRETLTFCLVSRVGGLVVMAGTGRVGSSGALCVLLLSFTKGTHFSLILNAPGSALFRVGQTGRDILFKSIP